MHVSHVFVIMCSLDDTCRPLQRVKMNSENSEALLHKYQNIKKNNDARYCIVASPKSQIPNRNHRSCIKKISGNNHTVTVIFPSLYIISAGGANYYRCLKKNLKKIHKKSTTDIFLFKKNTPGCVFKNCRDCLTACCWLLGGGVCLLLMLLLLVLFLLLPFCCCYFATAILLLLIFDALLCFLISFAAAATAACCYFCC